MTRPPGTIVVPISDDLARYHQFHVSLMALDKPRGTRLSFQTGISIPFSLNRAIHEAFHGEWLLVLGDDHIFPPDMLTRLIDHDVDIVVPLCFTRRGPFYWTIFRERTTSIRWETYAPEEIPEHGLFEVHAAGTAGMLVRRRVFEEIEPPWFENANTVHTGEDLIFCEKARAAGFKVHVDLDLRIGHIGSLVTNPAYKPGEGWGCLMEFVGGPGAIFIPGTDWRKTFGDIVDNEGDWKPVGIMGDTQIGGIDGKTKKAAEARLEDHAAA